MDGESHSAADAARFDALALARAAAGRGLALLLALQIARIAFRLAFLASTAVLVATLIMGGAPDGMGMAVIAVSLALATLASFAADRVQAALETSAARRLTSAIGDALRSMPARRLQALPAGALIVSAQRHPQAVAALVVGHRTARLTLAAGPLLAAGTLFCVSWQAAALVLALTPVMIVFFALVGGTIQGLADAQERSFARLAGQFADRVRTLPTILANHAFPAEEAKLAERLRRYADSMMRVLRIAFVNAGIIDFFSSLSIAMLALLLGLGHLRLATLPGFSNLALWQSLFILMIAPDYFAPFRRYSEMYHAKAEGVAAASALDRLMAIEAPAFVSPLSIETPPLPRRGLVAILGPSGSGKTILLRRLAHVEPGPTPFPGPLSWVSVDSFSPEAALGEAIAWGLPAPCETRVRLAAQSVGLLDETLLPGGLAAQIAAGGANLSGGQRLRVALARALLAQGAIFADEPTAKLGAATAALVRRALRRAARSRLVVVATHDAELTALADAIVRLGADEARDAA